MPEVRVVGTAGHVDHGKSTLVLALTGRDPDRLAEEKRRGLTIDLGFAWCELPSGREVGFVDVPGHERFVHNMLAGVGSLDACLLVVAANEGWMPQSEEHLRILQLLGADSGLVALTKVDTVDAETVELARLELDDHLKETGLAGAPVVEVAAPSGRGIEELRAALDHMLASRPPRADRGRPRLWIDRVFSLKGPGTVVTGTLAGGRLAKESEVVVLPSGARARVRSVQTHEVARAEALPGTRVALNLAGVGVEAAARGGAVVLPGQWLASSLVDAEVSVLAGAPAPLQRRGAHVLHVGTAEVEVDLRPLDGLIGPGQYGLARLRLARPLPLAPGDRFVLRDTGRSMTVGGGRVLDVAPARKGLRSRRPALEARRRALDSSSPEELARARLAEGPARLDKLPAELGLTEAEVAGAELIDLGGTVIAPGALEESAARLEQALARYHATHHLEPGMPRPEAVAALGLPAAALDALVKAGRVAVEGPAVRLPGHRVRLDQGEEEQAERVLAQLRQAGLQPPEAGTLGAPREMLDALVRQGRLEWVGTFLYDAELFRAAARRVREAARAPEGVTVSQVRELLGITRKHAVPLAEAFDHRQITLRRGDTRRPGPVEP